MPFPTLLRFLAGKAMPAGRALMVAVGAVLLVGACASYSGAGLKPGQSTRDDTRALMGEPAAVHAAPAGAAYASSWEYPRGPQGRHTFMARFNEQGTLVAIDQVLTLKSLASIRVGSDGKEQVRAILGRPAMVFPRRGGGEWWDYAAGSEPGPRPYKRYIVSFDAAGIAIDAGEMLDPLEQAPGPYP